MLIEGPNLQAEAQCEQVLRSLPAWFGIESSLLEYAHDSARLPTFAVVEDGNVVGFLSLHRHFTHSWEIYCMAIHADSRGKGYGRILLEHAERWVVEEGGTLLQVKTIADSHPSPEYRETRAFYGRMGFVPVEVFETLWSPGNPCLQMIKVVARK
jgi:GNAT superfamily N-acetyltransferase